MDVTPNICTTVYVCILCTFIWCPYLQVSVCYVTYDLSYCFRTTALDTYPLPYHVGVCTTFCPGLIFMLCVIYVQYPQFIIVMTHLPLLICLCYTCLDPYVLLSCFVYLSICVTFFKRFFDFVLFTSYFIMLAF